MNRLAAIVMTIFLLLMCAFCASAENGVSENALVLPSSIIEIGEEAFLNTKVEAAILPEGIRTIGARAFAGSALREIYLPASLQAIDDSAFADCDSLTVHVQDNTYAYAWAAAHGYVGDFRFSLDDDGEATILGTNVPVQGCLCIPERIDSHPVTAIAGNALQAEAGLVRVVLPASVRQIGSGAFGSCENLLCAEIQSAETAISGNAFAGCTEILTIYAPEGAAALGFAENAGIRCQATGLGDRFILLNSDGTQSGEAAAEADAIAAQNPVSVIRFVASGTITQTKTQQLLCAAGNPDVRAVIAVPAPDGLDDPFARIRTDLGRDDLLLISGDVYGVPAAVEASSDLTLTLDGMQMGAQFTAFAAARNCGKAVIYTVQGSRTSAVTDQMIAAVRNDIPDLQLRACPDPDTEGAENAAASLKRDMLSILKQYPGTPVCFLCLDERLQYALQQTVADNGNAFAPLPCVPSPLAGFQKAFGLIGGEYSDSLVEIAAYLHRADALERFSTWAVPSRVVMVRGAFSYAVQLAGSDNRTLSADAFAACASESAGVSVRCAANGSCFALSLPPVSFADYDPIPVYRALIIGEYNGMSGISNNLPFADKNCRFMHETLAASDIDGEIYRITENSDNPTKAQIQALIGKTFADAREKDISMIYIVSHGYIDSNKGYYFGIPSKNLSVAEMVYAQELMSWISEIKGSVTLVLDSCRSGGFISKCKTQLSQCGNISVLTAQTADKNASYYVGKDSANTMEFLTYALTKGLGYNAGYEPAGLYADADDDGCVTVREMCAYTADETVVQIKAKLSTFSSSSDYGLKIPGITSSDQLKSWSQYPQIHYATNADQIVIFA